MTSEPTDETTSLLLIETSDQTPSLQNQFLLLRRVCDQLFSSSPGSPSPNFFFFISLLIPKLLVSEWIIDREKELHQVFWHKNAFKSEGYLIIYWLIYNMRAPATKVRKARARKETFLLFPLIAGFVSLLLIRFWVAFLLHTYLFCRSNHQSIDDLSILDRDFCSSLYSIPSWPI